MMSKAALRHALGRTAATSGRNAAGAFADAGLPAETATELDGDATGGAAHFDRAAALLRNDDAPFERAQSLRRAEAVHKATTLGLLARERQQPG